MAVQEIQFLIVLTTSTAILKCYNFAKKIFYSKGTIFNV